MEAIHAALIADGFIEPVALGGADEAVWLDLELASLAENRLGDTTNPLHLDPERRSSWLAKATNEGLYAPSARDLERCYWIVRGGQRCGTVALAVDLLLDPTNVRLSSLYVLPSCRGQRLGRGVILALARRAAASGLGVRLTTSWTWQRTLRLYVAMGFWVRMWKHDLCLTLDLRDPSPVVAIGHDEASLSVARDDGHVELLRARRHGGGLALLGDEDLRQELVLRAASTLSLHLALAGWPLVRSPQHWNERRWADAGAPEALANRIAIWEAWERVHTFRVETPRIPGLAYPSWDEFQAQWSEGG